MAGKIMRTGTAVTSSCCTTLSMWDGANPHIATNPGRDQLAGLLQAIPPAQGYIIFHGLAIIQQFQSTVRGLKHRRKIV
jgi:hypothetical protein